MADSDKKSLEDLGIDESEIYPNVDPQMDEALRLCDEIKRLLKESELRDAQELAEKLVDVIDEMD